MIIMMPCTDLEAELEAAAESASRPDHDAEADSEPVPSAWDTGRGRGKNVENIFCYSLPHLCLRYCWFHLFMLSLYNSRN